MKIYIKEKKILLFFMLIEEVLMWMVFENVVVLFVKLK